MRLATDSVQSGEKPTAKLDGLLDVDRAPALTGAPGLRPAVS